MIPTNDSNSVVSGMEKHNDNLLKRWDHCENPVNNSDSRKHFLSSTVKSMKARTQGLEILVRSRCLFEELRCLYCNICG